MVGCIFNEGKRIKWLSDREKNYISCSRRGQEQEGRTDFDGAQNTAGKFIRQETNW